MPGDTLVIGIGNDFRRDDGVGLVVARDLRRHALAHVDCIEHDGEATGLLEAWNRTSHVVLVDAVRSGAPPGTILIGHGPDAALSTGRVWYSSHALGLSHAVMLAARLGRVPSALIVYGIEGEDFGFGQGLSATVERAAWEVVHRLVSELRSRHPAPLSGGSRGSS